MKTRSTGRGAPKRAARAARRKPPARPSPPDAAVAAKVGTTYETNVAPDLIEEGGAPHRAEAPVAECSLPIPEGEAVPD